MRQAILFYTFIAIFVATALVTLLGVGGAIDIPNSQLTILLTAFLVELAGAVIALFARTDFFADRAGSSAPSGDSLASSLGDTIEAFDQISDEIEAAIENEPVDPTHVHRFLIRRMGNDVVAYERMRVLKPEELEQLPEDQRDLVRTYEKSMIKLSKEWKKIKLQDGATSPLEPEVRHQQLDLLRTMKGDLVGVLDFLQTQGIYLDDHYAKVRHLVASL